MKVSTTFDYNQIQFDKENEVVLMTSFKAPKINLDKERAPLNLSLVLDVSGSMSGKKIDMLKSTASKLIQQLTGKDTLGIVAFTDYVTEVFKPSLMTTINKGHACVEISKLKSLSSTNLSGGLLKGLEQLRISELGKNQVHRILVFTDGQANCGITKKEELVTLVKTNLTDTPMTISCFGYGEDHSEDILKSIADEGKGNFYFIQNTDDIGKCFARELGGLVSCYAQNICVELEMKENTGSFLEVLNNLDVDSKSDAHIKVTFDDIYSEEEKHLLVKCKLNKVTKAVTQRASSVVKGIYKYNDMTAGGKEVKLDISAKLNFVKLEDVQKESTLAVLEQMGLIELSKALEQARKMADSGNFSGAQGLCGPTGPTGCTGSILSSRGSNIGSYIVSNLCGTSTILDAASYTSTASNNISSNARSLKSYRSVHCSDTLFVNSAQKEMEDKFKEPTSEVVADSSLGILTNVLDSTCSGTLQSNLETQLKKDGFESVSLGNPLRKRRNY